ncbi:hypothetical protein SDJN03_23137, partial [Cucurbita argyrosperma subsp. sororia]
MSLQLKLLGRSKLGTISTGHMLGFNIPLVTQFFPINRMKGAFILAEKKKRKAQLQEAKKKKKLSYDQSSDIDSKPVLSFGNLVHIHRQQN